MISKHFSSSTRVRLEKGTRVPLFSTSSSDSKQVGDVSLRVQTQVRSLRLLSLVAEGGGDDRWHQPIDPGAQLRDLLDERRAKVCVS